MNHTAEEQQAEAEYLYEERAAILEYMADLPREEAERKAREMMNKQQEQQQ